MQAPAVRTPRQQEKFLVKLDNFTRRSHAFGVILQCSIASLQCTFSLEQDQSEP